MKRIVEFIFYGNYFYGLCAVAITLETTVQLTLDVGGPLIFIMAFMATVLFYNYPYARNYASPGNNPRAQWYFQHQAFVHVNQGVFTVALLLCMFWLGVRHREQLAQLDTVRWLLLLIFPITGALYYGANVLSRRHSLRQIGWLKPFAIGFVWAGMANVYPILYAELIRAQPSGLTLMRGMLFLKCFMFVSMLAILFDIKDYADDSRAQLSTLIVRIGLRKTIFSVIIPLTVLGLLTFISYALFQQFSALRMLLIMVPFFLLIAVTRSFRKRRTLLYYLVVIDGLLIAKAVFGIVAMLV